MSGKSKYPEQFRRDAVTLKTEIGTTVWDTRDDARAVRRAVGGLDEACGEVGV